ncbi:MAG: hypothetical protein ACLR8Y_10155 [Alistipes indistinctus]
MAEIKNADPSVASSVVIDHAADTLSSEDMAVLNGLRSDSRFRNAEITTYTYEPLIGIGFGHRPAGPHDVLRLRRSGTAPGGLLHGKRHEEDAEILRL